MEDAAAATAAKPTVKVAAICGSLRKASCNAGLIRAAVDICVESVPGLQVEHVDISALPLLNTDLEVDGAFPPAVEAFREKIRRADCFLFASPEYNYSIAVMIQQKMNLALGRVIIRMDHEDVQHVVDDMYKRHKEEAKRTKEMIVENYAASSNVHLPLIGPLKNAIDWASRPPNCWADRAVAIASAAGKSGGKRSQYHIRQVGVFLDLHFINKPELFIQAFHPTNKFDRDGNLIDAETREQLKKLLLSLQAFTLRLQGKSPSFES